MMPPLRIADGHRHRMLDGRVQAMLGDEVWLAGERRSTGEQKYYVSNLPADATLKMLAATIKRDGSASKHISSSRKNWASIISNAAPGLDYIDTH